MQLNEPVWSIEEIELRQNLFLNNILIYKMKIIYLINSWNASLWVIWIAIKLSYYPNCNSLNSIMWHMARTTVFVRLDWDWLIVCCVLYFPCDVDRFSKEKVNYSCFFSNFWDSLDPSRVSRDDRASTDDTLDPQFQSSQYTFRLLGNY